MPSVPNTRRRPQPRYAPEAVHRTCRADGTRQRRRTVVESLRRTIRGVERSEPSPGLHLPVGAAEIDRVLPGGGLRMGCVHEVVGDEAGTGFCAVLLARCLPGTQDDRTGPALLWLSRGSDLYAPGLVRFGIGAGRLLVVSGLKRDEDLLWAMEEALRCPAVSGVVAEAGGDIGLAAARRLMLSAEGKKVLGLVLSRGAAGRQRPKVGVRAAVTRWRVTAGPGGPGDISGPETRWRVELLHCRGGQPGEWLVGWGD